MRRTGRLSAWVLLCALAGCSSGHSTAAPLTTTPAAATPTTTAPATTPAAPSLAATSAAPTATATSVASTSVNTPTAAATTAAPTSATAVPGPASWLGYHSDQSRTGAIAGGPVLNPVARAWSTDLGGAVRGQPVVADGRIFAATETNRVVALDPRSGKVVWSRSVGTPLTDVQSVAGCGDIDPLGITSTPVIDPKSGTIYVVAEVEATDRSVHHQLFGLALSTGAVKLMEAVDPPLPAGETPAQLLQRASLALGNGRVYVSYGGNDGDCGSYHGWVVGVSESGPAQLVSFEVAADGQGGAIWQSGGAPALDPAGDLYVSTGNANPDPPQGGPDPKAYTESVVKLSPDLKPLASFKDTVAGGDEDLSTGNPVLLPGGEVFAVGKTDVGYLLSAADLKQTAVVKGICGSDPDGGPAYDPASKRLFVPCKDGGLQVVDVATRTLGARLSGADSAPIVIGAGVWALDHSSGTLYDYDAATGARRQKVDLGADVPIFNSPSAGLGLLLVGTSDGVTALR